MAFRYFFFFLAFLFPLTAFCESLTPQQELQQIDEKLDQLQDMQNRSKSRAARFEDEGMRWQFTQNEKQEAKRSFDKADQEKQIIQKTQTQIDALNKQKEELLKKHPELKG